MYPAPPLLELGIREPALQDIVISQVGRAPQEIPSEPGVIDGYDTHKEKDGEAQEVDLWPGELWPRHAPKLVRNDVHDVDEFALECHIAVADAP